MSTILKREFVVDNTQCPLYNSSKCKIKRGGSIKTFAGGIILALLLFNANLSTAEQQKNFRELLVASSNIIAVYPIDELHTFVEPELTSLTMNVTDGVENDFVAACNTLGGVIEKKYKKKDPLNDRITEFWSKVELVDEGSRYIDATTGSKEKFRGAYLIYSEYRCNGVFEITKLFTHKFKSIIDEPGMRYHEVVKSFIVKHFTPQPFIYKSKRIPPLDKIAVPSDGELSDSVPEIVTRSDKGAASFLNKWVLNSKSAIKTNDYFGKDVLTYLNALCQKKQGKARFVTGKEEIDAMASFNYMLNYDENGYIKEMPGNWFFGCECNEKFIARGKITQTRNATGQSMPSRNVIFLSNRGLEDIKFRPLTTKTSDQ